MSGAFGEADERGQRQSPGPLRTSGTATLALAAGVLSFFCLFGFGGALAIALGWLAHNEIDRSEGRLAGRGLASTGIGLGIANLVFTVVGVGVLVALAVRPAPISAALASPTARPVPPPIAAPRLPAAPRPLAEAVEAVPTLPTLPPHIGKIAIVEASLGEDTLETQLLAQLAESSKARERLVLWTVTTDCEPCEAVGRALADARMQHALAKVRLVRADASAFSRELQLLGISGDIVPGFTLLDARAHAFDHIHGGEWDADIPANIAPILDKFLRHSLTQRRHPWARPLREGETPL
jgi:Domain of unknown function (DUF4190)